MIKQEKNLYPSLIQGEFEYVPPGLSRERTRTGRQTDGQGRWLLVIRDLNAL
jgi:hypothetical protein